MKHKAFLFLTLILAVACGGGKDNPEEDPGNGGGSTEEPKGTDYTDTDEFAFVDMGTSVLWATMNLGAAHSYEVGSYLEWSNITATYGADFANCRIPTRQEYDDLASTLTADGKYGAGPCKYKWVTVNGNKGYAYTSRVTGNAIFIPASGYYCYGSLGFTSDINNWTSTSTDESGYLLVYATKFTSASAPCAGAYMRATPELYTCPIRLVKDK